MKLDVRLPGGSDCTKKSVVKKLSTSADCAVDTAFLPFENSRDYYVKLPVKNILKVTA